ncbi:MAG: N-6 DNA methylase, partial [Kiritimatiellaeota bacterium]|nr:N-6 DNA methylase [Kiritimatiellota bacterium]
MERAELLQSFVHWCGQHIKGDEKGEAQIFLDRLFQAFEQGGVKEAGATCEQRVSKGAGSGTAFADLVWKPIVLIEMKKRGEPLQKHYRQAFDYWTRLVPNRPRYVILCNFDEFLVFDFETQMDQPVDSIQLANLPAQRNALAFLYPEQPQPSFGNDHVPITAQAAAEMASVFRGLVARGIERAHAQRYILQLLVCFFAEDIGLLPQDFVTMLLEECARPSDTFDLVQGLFNAMNAPQPAAGGRFKDVRYFNGGLFANAAALELKDTELVKLREISKREWCKVQPEIFGTLFEASSGADERHAFGQHFTHPGDIMKIVGPTITQPWMEQVEKADTLARLNQLLDRLHRFRVLDPACGSGNFLYLAYRDLKRVEARLFEKIAAFKSEKDVRQLGFLSAQNFFGLDINSFAVEIAKVTMMIARKLAVDELHIHERDLPLDNLDANFRAADALLDANGQPAIWPAADVIIGNPPFLGAKKLKPERGPDYVNTLRKAYRDVPGMADYCV